MRAQIELGPEGVAACVKETGVGFMFAPRYHPAMKVRHAHSAGCLQGCIYVTCVLAQHVAPVRKALGVRTAFNILGPMLNPAVRRALCVRCLLHALITDSISAARACSERRTHSWASTLLTCCSSWQRRCRCEPLARRAKRLELTPLVAHGD